MNENLYDSHFCRLCGENNSNGELLFGSTEDETDLSTLINQYLPLQVKDDGKLPRTVCPGCNIQLQATVQFFELLVEGQKKLREMLKTQIDRERKKKTELEATPTEIEIQATRFQGEDGNIYMMISVPSEKAELTYTEDNQLALRMEGLERPKRKRGRPPKPKVNPTDAVETIIREAEPVPEPEKEEPIEEEADGVRGRRRRRKAPLRYREEAVAGEMERIFREQGVIDPEEEDNMEEEDETDEVAVVHGSGVYKDGIKQVIGHMENHEGQDIGQLVVVSKSRKGSKQGGRGRRKLVHIATCEICGQTFPNRSKLHLHRLDHKWNYECVMCREKFSDKDSLDVHQVTLNHNGMLVHEDKNVSTKENEEISSKEVEEEIEQGCIVEGDVASSNDASCPECKRAFVTKEYLEDHIRFVHRGIKAYSCTICERKFAYPKNLVTHMEAEHGTKIETKEKENTEDDTFKLVPTCICDVCGKTFNHPSSVLYHKEAKHNEGRRYVCNKCGKSFKHKQLLQRHQLVHSDERPFACDLCSAGFKSKANLANHMATHTGEKKYFCDLCGQQFAHKTSLTLHYRWHTGEKPFHCKICGKNFTQNGNLQEHTRIHTGEKPFFCNYCGRRFTTSSQFKLHLKRHTGERPWKCEFCGKCFLHKDTWKCHVRRHRGERPFTCEFCQRGFTEQWALKKHVRIHTGEKPYSCEVCGKAFADCSNLTKHKKIHRGATQEIREDEGEGVVWQIINTPGDGEEGEDQAQHIIYVTYQNENVEAEEAQIQTEESNGEQPNMEMLQQLTQGNTGIVLPDGQEVILSTPGSIIPMTVPTESQIQLSETGANNATYQMTSADGMSMPVTLTMEDGQLVAHIPSGTQYLPTSKAADSESRKPEEDVETPETLEENIEKSIPMQIVTEDGRAVQLISTETEAGETLINIINT